MRHAGNPRSTALWRRRGEGPGVERNSDSCAGGSSVAAAVEARSGSGAAWRGAPERATSGRCHAPFWSCHQPGGIEGFASAGDDAVSGSAAAWRGAPERATSGRCHAPFWSCHQPGGIEGFKADSPGIGVSVLCAGGSAGSSADA